MAAQDTFESFTTSLSQEDREYLRSFISGQQAELFAARSEDARVRLVGDYVRQVREILKEVR